MLNKEDMNKYHTQDSQGYSQRTEGEFSQSAGATAKTVGGMAWRTVKTVLLVLIITACWSSSPSCPTSSASGTWCPPTCPRRP